MVFRFITTVLRCQKGGFSGLFFFEKSGTKIKKYFQIENFGILRKSEKCLKNENKCQSLNPKIPGFE